MKITTVASLRTMDRNSVEDLQALQRTVTEQFNKVLDELARTATARPMRSSGCSTN